MDNDHFQMPVLPASRVIFGPKQKNKKTWGIRLLKCNIWHLAQDLLKQMTPLDLRCHFPQDDLCFHANWQIHPIMNAFIWKGQVFNFPTPTPPEEHPRSVVVSILLLSLDYKEDIPLLALQLTQSNQSPTQTSAASKYSIKIT